MKKNDELEQLKEKLMPVLERAAIGDYSRDIKLEKNDPLNIIYGGIQVLINTIREQSIELQSHAKPAYHNLSPKRYKTNAAKLFKSRRSPGKSRS